MKQKQSKPAAYFDVPAMNTTAIASQFKQVCEEVADAIREQKGSTDKILPKDFSSEIRNISGGGSVKEYYYRLKEPTVIADVDEISIMIQSIILGMHGIVNNPEIGNVLTSGFEVISNGSFPCTAIMFYDIPMYSTVNRGDYVYSAKFVGDWPNRVVNLVSVFGGEITYDDAVVQINQFVEPITEEEFFNLVDVEIE